MNRQYFIFGESVEDEIANLKILFRSEFDILAAASFEEHKSFGVIIISLDYCHIFWSAK
jgi:hypothetical protein